jgi:hypothetical protein
LLLDGVSKVRVFVCLCRFILAIAPDLASRVTALRGERGVDGEVKTIKCMCIEVGIDRLQEFYQLRIMRSPFQWYSRRARAEPRSE